MDPAFLQELCCPETRQALSPAGPELLAQLNQRIALGQVRNRAGHPVRGNLTSGLVRADAKWIYPVQEGIPVLLPEAAMPLPQA